MLLNRLGEFGLIEWLKKVMINDSSVVVGPGDDCAVLAWDKKHYQLLTTDMLLEGVDFTLKDDPFFIGRKALGVSLSDIASCAGIPRYALVSVGLKANYECRFVKDIFRGINSLAKEFKVNIVGGDISRSAGLILNVAVVGFVEKKYLLLRSGAKEDDIIAVSGRLGGSIRGRHLRFIPRLKEARYLVENYKINSMIDISDGLAQDLGHILKASNKGALLYKERIPLAEEAKGIKDALFSGEDFELLFTLSHEEALRLYKKSPFKFEMIGRIVNPRYGLVLIDRYNRRCRIKGKGFAHF